jgi:hypothetical protein
MSSTAKDQCAEFIDQSILLVRVAVGYILLQPSEEFALAVLLAFETKADERRDRLAHTRVNRLGIPLHLISETGGQSDCISRSAFALTLPRLLPAAAAALTCSLGMRHMSSECLIPMHFGKPAHCPNGPSSSRKMRSEYIQRLRKQATGQEACPTGPCTTSHHRPVRLTGVSPGWYPSLLKTANFFSF